MAKYISRLSAAHLLSFIVTSLALTCPPDTRPLPPNSCLDIQDSAATFEASQTTCALAVIADEQFTNLVSYARVLGGPEQFYWLGYEYVGGSLQDTSGATVDSSSAILDSDNLGEGTQQDPGDGVCVAIGGDGKIYRRDCTEVLPAFCSSTFQAPSATITVDPDRFVTVGSGVTLTCTTSGSDITVTWRASPPGSSEPEPISEDITTDDDEVIEINSFSLAHAGAYYCVVSNGLGSYVSDPLVLVPAHNATTGAVPSVTLMSTPSQAQLDSPISFTCTYTSDDPVTNVQWFVNNLPADASLLQSDSVLSVDNLQEEGYYQCFVRTESGESAGDRILVSAQPGPPGPIEDITAQPDSRTQLFISWLCPESLRTHDEALLRYEILYHEGVVFDDGFAQSITDITPLLLSGEESEDCVVEAVVPGVTVGTTYIVKVVGVTVDDLRGEVAEISAIATTFGTAPGVVQDLTVQRTADDKTVVARWKAPDTTPPEGEVARYQIQYRDSEKTSISTVFHSHVYNYLVVTNVINANSYQVRVAAGVVVQREPLEYDYGEFTPWVDVNGITSEVPGPVPTEGLSTPSSVGAIAAGVTVGVLSLLIIIALIAVGVVCWVVKSKDSDKGDVDHTVKLSEVDSEPKAT